MTNTAKKKLDFIRESEFPEVYELLEKVRNMPENSDTLDARICLYWRYEVKPDQDGHVKHGEIQLCNPANRKLHGKDALLYLNYTSWMENEHDQLWKEALLFHEMYHLTISYDSEGEPKLNDDGEIVYRLRSHNIEDFIAVTDRYGKWTDTHVAFSDSMNK